MTAHRIAVVGWGSLIWDPRQLPLGSSWRPDGPQLPVEFARVSRDGRLTLALRDAVSAVQTLWAITSCASLEEARDQLARRERTDAARIGSLDCHGDGRVGSLDPVHHTSLPGLASWLSDRDLEGVIWTGLPSNFEQQTGEPLGVDAAIRYAAQLCGETRHAAEQYVRRAPAQVQTTIRACLERELGWTAAEHWPHAPAYDHRHESPTRRNRPR